MNLPGGAGGASDPPVATVVGPTRIAASVPTAEGERVAAAIRTALQAAATSPGPPMDVSRLTVRLRPGAGASEIARAVRDAIDRERARCTR